MEIFIRSVAVNPAFDFVVFIHVKFLGHIETAGYELLIRFRTLHGKRMIKRIRVAAEPSLSFFEGGGKFRQSRRDLRNTDLGEVVHVKYDRIIVHKAPAHFGHGI